MLTYKGEKGQNVMKSLNNTLSNVLPHRHVTKIVYTGKKVGSFFSIKDETKKQHQNDHIYHTVFPESICNENWISKVARRLQESVDEHAGKYCMSHMLEHTHTSQVIRQFHLKTSELSKEVLKIRRWNRR